MTGTRDISESSLLEESKESISPTKPVQGGNDSLFNISSSEIKEIQQPKAEQVEENNLLANMAKRKALLKDKRVPHITNLSEDEQMSGMVYFSLAKGEINFGRKSCNPPPEVILGAIGIK